MRDIFLANTRLGIDYQSPVGASACVEAHVRKPRGLCLHDGQNFQVPVQGLREDLEGVKCIRRGKETITDHLPVADRERSSEGRQPFQLQRWRCDWSV